MPSILLILMPSLPWSVGCADPGHTAPTRERFQWRDNLVGTRPCLIQQSELIKERASRGVFAALPGITGLAQVQKIDMSTPALLAETDAEMLATLGLRTYFRYLALTVLGKGAGDRIRG